MKNRVSLYVWSFVVMCICFGVGFYLATSRPLWNDELFSQVSSVRGLSYGKIFQGKIGENNNSPLFYVLQKALCQWMGYETPAQWVNGEWSYRDLPSQIFLRINPVFFMGMAVVAIFFFFSKYYGGGAGFYSLLVSFSSFMVWAYYAEARPYALWVFLTTIQSLIFLYLVEKKTVSPAAWNSLVVVHFLLCLTIVFGLVQVVIVSFLLWLWFEKDLKKYILLTVVPSLCAIYYYVHAPRYGVWFSDGPMALINASIPKDRMLIILTFALLAVVCLINRKGKKKEFLNCAPLQSGLRYLFFTLLMLAAAGCVLFFLKHWEHQNPQHNGFPASNRYFIYLTPVGIIATVLFSVQMMRALAGKRVWQILGAIGLAGLLFLRCYQTFLLVRGFYHA